MALLSLGSAVTTRRRAGKLCFLPELYQQTPIQTATLLQQHKAQV